MGEKCLKSEINSTVSSCPYIIIFTNQRAFKNTQDRKQLRECTGNSIIKVTQRGEGSYALSIKPSRGYICWLLWAHQKCQLLTGATWRLLSLEKGWELEDTCVIFCDINSTSHVMWWRKPEYHLETRAEREGPSGCWHLFSAVMLISKWAGCWGAGGSSRPRLLPTAPHTCEGSLPREEREGCMLLLLPSAY